MEGVEGFRLWGLQYGIYLYIYIPSPHFATPTPLCRTICRHFFPILGLRCDSGVLVHYVSLFLGLLVPSFNLRLSMAKRGQYALSSQILYLGVAGVAIPMFNVQSRFSSQESKDPYDELRTEIRNKVNGWQHCDLPCKPLPSHCEAFMCG